MTITISRVHLLNVERGEPEVISVIQAFILFFVAAPSVVRWIVRLRAGADEPAIDLATGWGAA